MEDKKKNEENYKEENLRVGEKHEEKFLFTVMKTLTLNFAIHFAVNSLMERPMSLKYIMPERDVPVPRKSAGHFGAKQSSFLLDFSSVFYVLSAAIGVFGKQKL
uniref:Uncharacterized protein n=1 Tax=Romanomermis culicivorax TaxID=13658 RepID=A0A915KBH8_ROMCU